LYVRSGDDDLGVDKLLVELGVLALLVRGGHESVTLVLEPLADAELVLSGTKHFGDLEEGATRRMLAMVLVEMLPKMAI
jgi:hypothetical protein